MPKVDEIQDLSANCLVESEVGKLDELQFVPGAIVHCTAEPTQSDCKYERWLVVMARKCGIPGSVFWRYEGKFKGYVDDMTVEPFCISGCLICHGEVQGTNLMCVPCWLGLQIGKEAVEWFDQNAALLKCKARNKCPLLSCAYDEDRGRCSHLS